MHANHKILCAADDPPPPAPLDLLICDARRHHAATINAFDKHFSRCGACKAARGKLQLCEIGEAALDEAITAGARRYRLESQQ